MNENEFDYSIFPKKRMAAGALFQNDAGQVLLVKPSYRESLLLPGGVIEENESPKSAAIREVQEELGLDIPLGKLLVVDYFSKKSDKRTESVVFVFDGGILNPELIEKIHLQEAELLEYKFVDIKNFEEVHSTGTIKRARLAKKAFDGETCYYLENGEYFNSKTAVN
jgi:8-oxo-dGTP diphosphatase